MQLNQTRKKKGEGITAVAVAQHFKKNKLFKIIIKTNLFRSDFKEVVFLVVT
jgi:hypothetical protein